MKKSIIRNNILNILKTSYVSLFRACVAFFYCLFLISNANANEIIDKNIVELTKIENYLNNLKNLSADFVQESPGGFTTGKFLLSRPGKMRIEYFDNPKILIVVNGSVLSYKDIELDEVSRLSTNTTPASLLTRKNISFDAKDVEIVAFDKNEEFISVSVVKKNRPEAGQFRLIFKRNPFGFVKMEVKDDLEQVTSISLKNITFPDKLKSKLFIIRNKNLPL